jgi:hypothetical protein
MDSSSKCLWSFAILAIAAALSPAAGAATVYGLTTTNGLVVFDSATPGSLTSSVPVTGLVAGDTLVGIDFRPANGQLYGLGSGSRLYSINRVTGVATQVGSSGAFTLNGTSYGFDFNPTVDRIRVVSDVDQNLRLNPDTGGLAATDLALTYAAGDSNAGQNPNVVGSAYTNNFPGSVATTLYGIDSALDILAIQNPPNNGTLNTVGALGVNTIDRVGFDIFTDAGGVNNGFASLTVGANSNLYTINLTTGAATLVGVVDGGVLLNDIAVQPLPIPPALLLGVPGALCAFVGAKRIRRR